MKGSEAPRFKVQRFKFKGLEVQGSEGQGSEVGKLRRCGLRG